IDSNFSFPLLTAARMRFGRAVHTKGLGSALVSATKWLMASSRSATDRNTPRLRRRFVSLAKKPSTALSHDAEVSTIGPIARWSSVGANSPRDRPWHSFLSLQFFGGAEPFGRCAIGQDQSPILTHARGRN